MERVIRKLDAINKNLESILAVIKKPENKFEKMLEYGGAGVGILGILSIVELIRTWIVGG
jgi:preprotein translocase subunit Sss1